MNKRLTLVTLFSLDILQKIDFMVNKNNIETCKVPYGIDNERRKELDTLPYHFTISAWDEIYKNEILEMLNTINFSNIDVSINNVEIMNGRENSYVLYLSVEDDAKLKKLLKEIYSKLPSKKYNPETFKFHITLDIDKDYGKISGLKNKFLENFEPFDITIKGLGLFEIYPANKIYEILDK